MIFKRESALKKEILRVGSRLYRAGLAVAKSGNISARLDEKYILITATGTALGRLTPRDIVKVNLATGKPCGKVMPSSELPMHSLVYNNFNSRVVVHCHPPLINGYFAVTDSLKPLTFEAKFYLGEVPVVPQETPTVTKPEKVIEALRTNNLVALKNHGTVAIGEKFEDALSLTEALEEAVRATAVARLFKNDILDDLDRGLREVLIGAGTAYPMFSRQHIQAILEMVNKDEFIAQKGQELDLTVRLAVKLDGSGQAYTFTFEKGKIIRLDDGADAPFIISASKDIWELVFLGNLDSFVAVTQGKMKLQGQLGQLSKWYVPFSRLFAIFKEVPFK